METLAHGDYVNGGEVGAAIADFFNLVISLVIFPFPYFGDGRVAAGIVALILWAIFWFIVLLGWLFWRRTRPARRRP